MSSCHCQCQPDHHIVLQSKINAMLEPTRICVQELIALGTSFEVNLTDSSNTHTCIWTEIHWWLFIMIDTCNLKFQEAYGYILNSEYSPLHDGGAGRNSALSISTSVHVVFSSPINSKPELQV